MVPLLKTKTIRLPFKTLQRKVEALMEVLKVDHICSSPAGTKALAATLASLQMFVHPDKVRQICQPDEKDRFASEFDKLFGELQDGVAYIFGR
jgi:hypothetical protein